MVEWTLAYHGVYPDAGWCQFHESACDIEA